MKNNNLLVVLDTVGRIKNKNTLIIKGWTINLKDKTVPQIGVVSKEQIISELKKIKFRGDVNCVYQIPVEVCCGFSLAVEVENINRGEIVIVFSSENEKKKIKFDLNKKYCHSNEIGNPQKLFFSFYQKSYKYVKRNGIKNTLKRLKIKIKNDDSKYQQWINEREGLVQISKIDIKEEMKNFKHKPKISIIVPVYNVEEKWLKKCMDSVIKQDYTNWELCIADDCSTDPQIKTILEEYINKDERIKVVFRKENGHISEASNSALKLATGEFVGLLDNDDELSQNALYEVVKLINQEPVVDFIYSDEDKLDEKGKRKSPYFKSDWAPDSLMSGNYICHFSVFRKILVDQVGGFRTGYEGAQDYDLILRVSEKTKYIYHIPKILYHWRMLKSSTASIATSKNYAFEAGKRALESSLERRNLKGVITNGAFLGLYDVHYDIKLEELVSIIIPTRDSAEDVRSCIDSIFLKTNYRNFEIVLADNGSEKKETFELFEEYKLKYPEQFKVIKIDIPFNYALINNIAVKEARGKYLVFLNNDTKIISENWMRRMVSYAQLDHVGAVGAKLYYPDDTIQHAGVVLGMGGAAGHVHYFFPKGDNGYYGKLVSAVNYLAVTGACLMVQKSIFEQVGCFEEIFTVAYNDVDLCVKIYEAGYYNVCLHDAELYHFESKSRGYEDSSEKKKRFAEEINMLRKKWMKYIKHDPFYNQNLTKQHSDYSINLDE